MRRDDWMGWLRHRLSRGHYLTAKQLELAGFGRDQVRWAELLFRILRKVDRGLYVDANLTADVRWVLVHARVPRGVVTLETAAHTQGLLQAPASPLWVALPHSEHPPRSSIQGLAFQYLRARWDDEELEPFSPPGLPGLALVRFTPARVFAELAAAGRLASAHAVGRALLTQGASALQLENALSSRGLTRNAVRRCLSSLA